MTARQVFSVGCRVLAVYVLINATFAIPTMMAWVSYGDSPGYLGVIAAVVLLTFGVIIARFLWYRSDWIVAKLFGGDALLPADEDSEEEEEDAVDTSVDDQPLFVEGAPVTLATLQPVLFSLLGVYLVALNLPSLVSTLLSLIAAMNDTSANRWEGVVRGTNPYLSLTTLLPLAVRLGIGVYLVVGANGLSAWLTRVRQARMPV